MNRETDGLNVRVTLDNIKFVGSKKLWAVLRKRKVLPRLDVVGDIDACETFGILCC